MSTPPIPIGSSQRSHSRARSPFSNSYVSSSPIAQQSIERDLAECSDAEDEEPRQKSSGSDSSKEELPEASTLHPGATQHAMASSYRRPSFVAYGGTRPAVTGPHGAETPYLTKKESRDLVNEERSLLRDNHLAPPKHPEAPKGTSALRQAYRRVFGTKVPRNQTVPGLPAETSVFAAEPTETSALLPQPADPESHRARHERLNQEWEAAVLAGKIKTTWPREARSIFKYSGPLVVTFILQYSLTVASIFTVGHLGTIELGAVSLASMTANITGYAIYQGLVTSLDTLCAQAYGSGKKHLVGLQLQRMVYFLWVVTIPIGILWFFAAAVLEKIVPEKRSAEMAGLYLRVLIIGAPGYCCFEAGKRFVQAQGLFSATTYVLLLVAPLNAFMNWLFVWHFKWGFIGAPIAVVISDNLLPLCLFLYVRFVDGRQCWNGLTTRAFTNWWPMIKLALPGLLMVETEYLAFEILTLASSYFSTTHLAAQSVLLTICSITFQFPFPISIVASTRVANLIGATLSDAARTSAKVAVTICGLVGILNIIVLSTLRNHIPKLFSTDPAVIDMVSAVLPLCAAMQLFDALVCSLSGVLRGLGKQSIGGYINLFCYYVIALPVGFGTAFGLRWELWGLWGGVTIALVLVTVGESLYLVTTEWKDAVDDAERRNNAA